MARVQDIRIRYAVDETELEQSKQTLREIGNEVDATEKEVRRVNQQYSKQVGLIEELENEMRQLDDARRKAQDPKEIKKYNKALKETEGRLVKMKGQSGFGGLTKGVKQFGAAIAASISVGALASFAVHLSQTALELENIESKSRTVFGTALPMVEEWARKSAAAMGLSQAAAVGAATAMGDLLIPMGFTREEAAKMSTEVVGLAGALSEWSGGQRSAEEVAQILSKAMLGEREQLKELGIAISEADVQQRLLEKGQSKLTGVILQQAKAVATQELIFEKSADAQAAYAKNSGTLARQQAELKAIFKTIADTLARVLLPAFKSVVGFVSRLAKGFAELIVPSDSASAALRRQQAEVRLLGQQVVRANISDEERKKKLDELVKVYPELSKRIDVNTASNEELAAALNEVNREMEDQLRLLVLQEELNAANAEVKKALVEQMQIEAEIDELLATAKGRLGVELEANLTKQEEIAKVLEELDKRSRDYSATTGSVARETQILGIAFDKNANEAARVERRLRELTEAQGDVSDAQADAQKIAARLNAELRRQRSRWQDLFDPLKKFGIQLDKVSKPRATPPGTDPKKLKKSKDRIDPLIGSLEYFNKLLGKLAAQQKKVRIGSEAEAQIKQRIQEVKRLLGILQSEVIEPWELTGEEMNNAMMRGFRGRFEQAKEGMRKLSEDLAKEAEEGLRKAELREFWEQQLDSGAEFAGQLFDTFGQIQEAAFAQRFAKLEEMRQKELQLAGADVEKREQIEEEFDKRAETLRREQFQEEKEAAKQRAIIEGVLLVLKSVIAGGGIPAGIPQGLLAAAQVAAQIAIIDAATFAKGGFTGKGSFRDGTGERVAGVVHEDEFVFQKGITKKHLPEFTRVWKGEDPYHVFASKNYSMTAAFHDGRIVGAIGSQTGKLTREMKRQNRLLSSQNRLLASRSPVFKQKKRLFNG